MNLDRIIAVRNDKTVFRDGDRCVKVFNEGYSKADVLNEALNQARVEETGLFVPKVLEVMVIEGKWAIVSEFIRGRTLEQLMADEPENKEKHIGKLVDIQMKIHSTMCPDLAKLKDKMNRKICDTDLPATLRFDLHSRLDAMPKHSKLCHGDLEPSNVIITEDGTPCIVDWSHATQGNAAADTARTYLLFWLNGDIDGAEKYLDMFCQKSHAEVRYVKKWMPIVAAAESARRNESRREFLHSWINAVDYD